VLLDNVDSDLSHEEIQNQIEDFTHAS
jgi:hypothetical protein